MPVAMSTPPELIGIQREISSKSHAGCIYITREILLLVNSVPIVPKGFVVVALQLFGNEFVFEPADLFGGQNRILRARDQSPFRRLTFFCSTHLFNRGWIDPFNSCWVITPRAASIVRQNMRTTANPLDLFRLSNSLNLDLSPSRIPQLRFDNRLSPWYT